MEVVVRLRRASREGGYYHGSLFGGNLAWLLATGYVCNRHRAEGTCTGQLPWDTALYYSLVSFSALGYGSWIPQPAGWVKWVGAAQPIVGITSFVALSISLTQRVSR